jgi:hypothetical protein
MKKQLAFTIHKSNNLQIEEALLAVQHGVTYVNHIRME